MVTVESRPKGRATAALFATIGELCDRLGGISPHRVCADPPPGTATVRDYARRDGRSATGAICELADGTLLEKPMGASESVLAQEIAFCLRLYLRDHPIGYVGGEAYLVRLAPGLVRVPDVSVTLWGDQPAGLTSSDAVTNEIPALVVEVLSRSNTAREMARKVEEYFRAGVRVVWIVDPKRRRAEVYTGVATVTRLDAAGTLTAEAVLPGFALPLATAFAWLPKATPRRRKP